MSSSDGKDIGDHDGLSAEDVFNATLEGRLDPRRSVTPEQVQAFQRQVGEILENAVAGAADETIHTGVHVITIYNPEHNIYYHTISINGKIDYSVDEAGKWEPDKLHDNIDPLLMTLARCSVPTPAKKKTRGSGGNPNPPKPRPRAKPLHKFDPRLFEYGASKSRYLVAAEYHDKGNSAARELSREELDHCCPQIGILAKQKGYRIKGETIENFVHRNDPQIRKFRVEFQNALLDERAVSLLLGKFLTYVGKRTDNEEERIVQFYSKGDNAKLVYDWFKENNDSGFASDNVFGAIRDWIVNTYIEEEDDTRDPVMHGTAVWGRVITAAEYVNGNPELRSTGMDAFLSAEEAKRPSERTYEGMRQLQKLVLVDGAWTMNEYTYFVRSLALLGSLHTKRKSLPVGEPPEAGDQEVIPSERKFKVTSAYTTFINPVSHWHQRQRRYKPVIDAAIDMMLESGAVEKGYALNSRKDDHTLAKRVVESIDEQLRARVFTHLRDGSNKLVASYITLIVQPYFATNREAINQKIDAFYDGKS